MNKTPGNKITKDDIRAYDEDGVVCLRQMFDREWVDRMHDASLRYIESGVGDHRVRDIRQALLVHPKSPHIFRISLACGLSPPEQLQAYGLAAGLSLGPIAVLSNRGRWPRRGSRGVTSDEWLVAS